MKKASFNNHIRSKQAIIRFNTLFLTVYSVGLFLTGCAGTNTTKDPGAFNQSVQGIVWGIPLKLFIASP